VRNDETSMFLNFGFMKSLDAMMYRRHTAHFVSGPYRGDLREIALTAPARPSGLPRPPSYQAPPSSSTTRPSSAGS